MLKRLGSYWILATILLFSAAASWGQLGNSGSIEGVVKDQSGASVPGAKVEISNPVSSFHRETTTDADGSFRFTNVPFNPYHLVVKHSHRVWFCHPGRGRAFDSSGKHSNCLEGRFDGDDRYGRGKRRRLS